MLLDRCAHPVPRSGEARPRTEPGDGESALREGATTERNAIERVGSMGEDTQAVVERAAQIFRDLRLVGAKRGD
jgi:hypothetical protein